VGARDAWAKYGVAQQRDEYELLREVTHWTDADVERERQIARRPNVTPSVTLDDRFAELLNYFEFVKNGRR
jgi:phosphoglycolate phosphatase